MLQRDLILYRGVVVLRRCVEWVVVRWRLRQLHGRGDDDGAHDAAGEAAGGRGDGVEDGVLAGRARVDRGGGRGRAV